MVSSSMGNPCVGAPVLSASPMLLRIVLLGLESVNRKLACHRGEPAQFAPVGGLACL